jgi:hypothetical protein
MPLNPPFTYGFTAFHTALSAIVCQRVAECRRRRRDRDRSIDGIRSLHGARGVHRVRANATEDGAE